MINKITTEGTTFYYDIDFIYQQIPDIKIVISNTHDPLKYIPKKELTSICRPVLISDPIRNVYYLEYLFWLEKTDLKEIDSKVLNQSYTDRDFYYAVKTDFIKNLLCFDCSHAFPAGLAFHPVQTYPDNKTIGKTKKNLVKDSGKILSCPKCGGRFRANVLHVFE